MTVNNIPQTEKYIYNSDVNNLTDLLDVCENAIDYWDDGGYDEELLCGLHPDQHRENIKRWRKLKDVVRPKQRIVKFNEGLQSINYSSMYSANAIKEVNPVLYGTIMSIVDSPGVSIGNDIGFYFLVMGSRYSISVASIQDMLWPPFKGVMNTVSVNKGRFQEVLTRVINTDVTPCTITDQCTDSADNYKPFFEIAWV